MIGYRRKFIFIHIPKTAGQSVTKALRPHALWPHQRVIQRLGRHLGCRAKYDHYDLKQGQMNVAGYQYFLSPDTFEKYFSFAFVRNPWDRMLSTYAFTKKRPGSPFYDVAIKGSLDDFIAAHREVGVIQQIDFLRGHAGDFDVQFIGRFERLAEDIADVGRRLGVTLRLPHKNASSHRDYRESYTRWGRDAVAEIAQDDINSFGYSFD